MNERTLCVRRTEKELPIQLIIISELPKPSTIFSCTIIHLSVLCVYKKLWISALINLTHKTNINYHWTNRILFVIQFRCILSMIFRLCFTFSGKFTWWLDEICFIYMDFVLGSIYFVMWIWLIRRLFSLCGYFGSNSLLMISWKSDYRLLQTDKSH